MDSKGLIRKTWEQPVLRKHVHLIIDNQNRKCHALADRLEKEIKTLKEMVDERDRLAQIDRNGEQM
jgi:hypothetical protein